MRYMKYRPSTFFAGFSLSEMVRNSPRLRRGSPFGSGVGAGGGGGGGTANSSSSTDSSVARYHKSESFSFQVGGADDERFDATEFIASLKAEVEKEINEEGARLKEHAAPDSSSFYFEYSEEGITGRIEISCRLSKNSCTLSARLTETSTKTGGAAVGKMMPERKAQPTGNYYVVPFAKDEVKDRAEAFIARWRAAMNDSMARVRDRLIANPPDRSSFIQSLSHAEVYIWTPMSAEIKERVQEFLGEVLDVPPEYDRYGKVFFLNEAARTLYEEAGEKLEVLKVISAEEVSKIPGPSLRGHYLPKES